MQPGRSCVPEFPDLELNKPGRKFVKVIITETQKANGSKRRFSWLNHVGSIYVNPNSAVDVSSPPLIELATRIMGEPEERKPGQLDSYKSWRDVEPYQLADLLYHADKLLSRW